MNWLYVLTFISGFAALVYEMLWTRQLSLVLGSTTAAISTVVAAYMGGLALGSAVIGRWADQWRRLLAWYALLELGIGITALAVLFLIPALERIYPAITAATESSGPLLSVTRFLLTFGLLLIPTSLMGGTYPVLVKAITQRLIDLGGTAGKLYAANTLGAVAGCFAAGVYLLGAFGVDTTAYLAVGLNLAIAGAAILITRFLPVSKVCGLPDSSGGITEQCAPLSRLENTASEWRTDTVLAESSQVLACKHAANHSTLSAAARRGIAVAMAGSGFLALGYEVVWSRALGIVLGSSIYAFTFVLSTYLAGLALGGYLAALLVERFRIGASLFCWGFLAVAVAAGASLYLIPSMSFYNYNVYVEPISYIGTNLSLCGLMLLPPTVLFGALLPMAIHLYTAELGQAGAQIGTVYAWNTIGSIAGSLTTGFFLIPWLGTQPAFLLLVLGNLLVALALGMLVAPQIGRLLLNVVLIGIAAFLFTNSHGSPLLRDKSVQRVEAILQEPVVLEYFAEDQVASVGLCHDSRGGKRLFTNGVPMTNLCIETTWMAHLPIAIARKPDDVLILCLGMGNTVLSALRYEVNLTAVEISPQVVAAVRRLHGDALRLDEHDRIIVADARNTVLVATKKFDVITIDPPPPLHSVGSVNFHTVEFYEACRTRLNPGGVLCQWIPFEHCTESEYKILLRSFYEVFPRMAAWTLPQRPSGLYLIAWGDEVDYDRDAVRRALATPIVAADIARFDDRALEEVLPRELLRDEQVALFCGAAPVMTDKRPWLEFPLFRNARHKEPLMRVQPILEFLEREHAIMR